MWLGEYLASWRPLRDLQFAVGLLVVIVGLFYFIAGLVHIGDGIGRLITASHEHDLKVCMYQEAVYNKTSDSCRDLLAEEAVAQQEEAERKAKHN